MADGRLGGATPRLLRKRFRRRGPAEESAYREHSTGGATFFTSRQEHQELTVVVKRFPAREAAGPVAGARDTVRTDSPSGEAFPVFVLVHGLGVSSRYFHPVAAELARVGRVFLVDLPGYGAAPDPRRAVSLDDHAAVLAGLLGEIADRWPDAGTPVVVGHSMGAQVVAIAAVEHAELVDRVVLMAPTMAPRWRGFWRATSRLLIDALREPPRVFLLALADYVIRCGPVYLIRQSRVMLADDLEERMPAVPARVLVVCGDRDAIVPVGWGERLAALAPEAAFREVRGPHVVMHTDPVTIATAIAKYARTPGRAA